MGWCARSGASGSSRSTIPTCSATSPTAWRPQRAEQPAGPPASFVAPPGIIARLDEALTQASLLSLTGTGVRRVVFERTGTAASLGGVAVIACGRLALPDGS